MLSPEVRKLIVEQNQKAFSPCPLLSKPGEGNKEIELTPSPPLKNEGWRVEKPPQGRAKGSIEFLDTFRGKETRLRSLIGRLFHVHNTSSARFAGLFLLLFLPFRGVA